MSAEETNSFFAFATCGNNAGCTNAPDPFACLIDNCLAEDAVCRSGGTFGPENCASLTQCTVSCVSTGTVADCLRGCYTSATQEAVEAYAAIQFCANGACVDTPTQACVQAAIEPGGACEDLVGACQTGASP